MENHGPAFGDDRNIFGNTIVTFQMFTFIQQATRSWILMYPFNTLGMP
jgi:myo-inositol-1-phosphate synthase